MTSESSAQPAPVTPPSQKTRSHWLEIGTQGRVQAELVIKHLLTANDNLVAALEKIDANAAESPEWIRLVTRPVLSAERAVGATTEITKEKLVNMLVEEMAAEIESDIAKAHIKLSDALESEGWENAKLREAAIDVCASLNAIKAKAAAALAEGGAS